MNDIIAAILLSVVIFIVVCVEASARQCASPCELERRVEALEYQLTSGYWYPYPPDRDGAEQN